LGANKGTDSRARDLVARTVEIAQEDAKAAGSIAFQSRIFCQLSLPHREPPPDPRTGAAPIDWVRKNGSLTLRLRPGLVGVGTDNERYGYPYGVMPRYLLTWISTEITQSGPAVQDDGLTLDLGGSMRAFLKQIGIQTATGGKKGSATRLRDQVTRLATSTITITDTRVMGDGVWNFHSKNFGMIDEADLWWSDRPTHSDTLWPNTITISPAFRDSIKASSVPLDTRGLALIQQAKAGPLALDLYTWLAHRFYSLRRTTTVPWTLLSEQFGSQYAQTRQFRARVIKTLSVVRLAYPGANVTPTTDGLMLRPSPLPVARKIVLDA
jgi:hypothetical protein